MGSLQSNHNEFTELMKEQEHCQEPARLHQIWIRMAELNRQYFGTPTVQPKGVLAVPAE